MRDYDFSPLLRSMIGFDRMQRTLTHFGDNTDAYPPYNIEKTGDDSYRVTLAVAGFTQDDITITAQDQSLTIEGKLPEPSEERIFLHRGIAGRAFKRVFQLADYIRVVDAKLDHGLLSVELVREVPEQMKPRTIAIQGADSKPAING